MLIDSSVWIDFFNRRETPQTLYLRQGRRTRRLIVGDLVLAEVLRGFRDDRAVERARAILLCLDQLDIVGRDIALMAADRYRHLRERGITIRKTVDVLIATRCARDGIELLYSDRDFDPFVLHFGLRSAMPFGAN